MTQYSVWVAMLVYAYRQGGAAIAGLVAVAQLVPAAVLAPLATAVADRCSPVFLLAGGYLVQAAGMAATAVAVITGVPLAAYAAAVVAAVAVATTRPAQSAKVTRATPTMRSPLASSTPPRTGTSCAGADAARESARSPCCATSRAPPP